MSHGRNRLPLDISYICQKTNFILFSDNNSGLTLTKLKQGK